MKKITKLLLIIGIALVSTNSVSAFTQKNLNQYNNFKSQYLLTKRKLTILKKNVKAYKNKAQLAHNNGDKAAFSLYMAKLDDASFQRESRRDDIEYLLSEIESFDEIEDTHLIALN
jgi:hypothetical protein